MDLFVYLLFQEVSLEFVCVCVCVCDKCMIFIDMIFDW